MAITRASACGKTILLGEHAVVYGRPAIAVPVPSRRAVVEVRDTARGSGIVVIAQDLQMRYQMGSPDVDEHGRFLLAAVAGALAEIGPVEAPDLELTICSSIPIARGMGSGAAVSAAIARGIAGRLGASLSCQRLSELVYDTERLLHGTPSGIDNTVVAYEAPVWFQRDQGAEPIALGRSLELVIGDTGIPSRTRESVALVRRRWESNPAPLETLFDAVGAVVQQGRDAIAQGDLAGLGRAMDRNQGLLEELGVSDPALERLIVAAREAGALGAKLSGGGMGGCMIALVAPEGAAQVEVALRAAGASDALATRVGAGGAE